MGLAAQVFAWQEPLASGRPIAGHLAYLSSLATVAALISIFGARTPGGGAWAILMGLLVLVFLLPWLEGSGLAGGAGAMGRLRLDPPWSIFFGLLVVAGVTNFLPTRFGVAACMVGISLGIELAALSMSGWEPSKRARAWSDAPTLLAIGILFAIEPRRLRGDSDERLANLWLWFRDHWGVVWALRVRERFNRAADGAGWPIRLSWQGPVSLDGGEPGEIPEAAVKTLASLLKRFAEPARLESAAGGDCRVVDHRG
jgi:hypothetical protein